MSMDKVMEKINDEALGTIAGGMSRNMKAAYDVYDDPIYKTLEL